MNLLLCLLDEAPHERVDFTEEADFADIFDLEEEGALIVEVGVTLFDDVADADDQRIEGSHVVLAVVLQLLVQLHLDLNASLGDFEVARPKNAQFFRTHYHDLTDVQFERQTLWVFE